MSTTDQDHLPIRTISTADTFNDWRRITNSIAESAKAAVETGSHLYLGDYDWTGDVFRMTALPEQATTGTESPVGATWDPADEVSYDLANGGVRFTLANTSYGNEAEKYQQWVRIRTRVPIDPNATYRIKVRIKNLRTSGENRIYLGAIGLNESFQALRTDDAASFNYALAEGLVLPNADVNNGITEYSALMYGFNATNEAIDNKFDPGSKFFDIIYVNHYTSGDEWATANDDTIIQNIEIERLTSGIIITEHDTQDENPRGKMQIGYSSEDIIRNATVATNVSLNLRENLVVKGGSIITSYGGSDNANVDMIYADDANEAYGNSWHFQLDQPYKNNIRKNELDEDVRIYEVNSHASTLRGGRIVMDTDNDDISSLRSKLFIGKSVNYNTTTQTPTGLLNLAIGSANADEVGAGPAINFYTPDSTATDLQGVTDIELTDCQLSGQIACVKSEAPTLAANPEAYGTGDMVFKVATNAQSLVEILRLEPDGHLAGKSRKVTVGTASNNADLEVIGNLSRIRNLTYTWPTSRTGGGVDGTSRVLTDNGLGTLSWKTVSAVSQNVTAFVQNETAPLGTVFAWASGQSIPNGFEECKGQAISSLTQLDATEKTALQTALGISTLPDLRQKVVVGRKEGVNNFAIRDIAGSSDISGSTQGKILTQANLPSGVTGSAYLWRTQLAARDGVLSGSEDLRGTDGNLDGNSTLGGDGPMRLRFDLGGQNLAHSHDINLGANSNYQPYVALTYIMKVKADKIATLDITLGDSQFDEFETTGGTLGEIGFETTNLKLSDGHPTWTGNGHLYVSGFDLRMNTSPSGAKGDSGRQQGRALVADTNGLTINYAGDFDQVNLRGDKVIAGDLSNAEIDAAGNKSLVTKEYIDSWLVPNLVQSISDRKIQSAQDLPSITSGLSAALWPSNEFKEITTNRNWTDINTYPLYTSITPRRPNSNFRITVNAFAGMQGDDGCSVTVSYNTGSYSHGAVPTGLGTTVAGNAQGADYYRNSTFTVGNTDDGADSYEDSGHWNGLWIPSAGISAGTVVNFFLSLHGLNDNNDRIMFNSAFTAASSNHRTGVYPTNIMIEEIYTQ